MAGFSLPIIFELIKASLLSAVNFVAAIILMLIVVSLVTFFVWLGLKLIIRLERKYQSNDKHIKKP